MQKQFLILLMIASLLSCSKKQNRDFVVLHGNVESPGSDSLGIQNGGWKTLSVIRLNKDNTFRDTLKVPDGFYFLKDGNKNWQLYLKPGFDLEIALHAEEYSKTAFSGIGAAENNYLVRKGALEDSLTKFEDYHYYGKLGEDEFLALSDSVYQVKINLFNKYAARFGNDFIFLEENTLKYRKLSQEAHYESARRMLVGNKEFNVSSGYYPNLFKGIDLSDSKLAGIPDYVHFVDSYIYNMTENQLSGNDSTDFFLMYLENAEKNITNVEVLKNLISAVGKERLTRTTELDKVYAKIKDLLGDSLQLKKFTARYQQLKKIERGAVSPSFQLDDINGKPVSLEDLRGQFVYIDVWSPYCLPCMAEIPYLNEFEKSFRNSNIRFVSICVGETKAGWEKLVKDKGLKGIQLIATNERIPFFREYMVQGIPRFILVDKEGKIIDSSAKRPSDPQLKVQLTKLLQNE